MRLRGKLGNLTIGELVGIIVILLSTSVILGFMFGFRSFIDASGNKECEAQIRQQHLANTWADRTFVKDVDACPTTYVEMKDTNPTAIKSTIAHQMSKCWKTWGKGDLDLFSDEGDYCQVCSIISFDKDYGTMVGFNDYLAHQVTYDGLTYLEYLQPQSRKTKVVLEAPGYTFDTNKDIAVMFYYKKSRADNILKTIKTVTGIDVTPIKAGGVTAVGIIAAGTVANYVTLSTIAEVPVIGPIAATAFAPYAEQLVFAEGIATGAYVSYAAKQYEGWHSVSAIYLTPNDPNNYYVQQCKIAASTTVSP